MKKLAVIGVALLMLLVTSIGCGESVVDRAKAMAFGKAEYTLNELILAHPQVIKESVEWFEDDSMDLKGAVICRFKYIPHKKEKDLVGGVTLLFAVGKKTGSFIEMDATNPHDPSRSLSETRPLEFDGLIYALENHMCIWSGVLGGREEIRDSLIPFDIE